MLTPWKESYDQPKQHLKSRHITLPTKVHLVNTMVFSIVLKYGCESWTIKKAEHRRIDAFELWCWRRLLRVPWTARRSNQSILKEISPGCLLEGLMLKLKFQYFGHLIRRADSFEKTLMLRKIEGRRRRGRTTPSTKLLTKAIKKTEPHILILVLLVCACVRAQFLLSCLTFCDPMDCSSSVHGILQARIQERVAISFSRGIFPTQGSNLSLLHCR